MHHHPRRLIDHRQIVVFVNNVERNVLGNGPQRLNLRPPKDADLLATTEPQRRLAGFPVDQHQFLLNQLLHPRPANVSKLRNEELIQTNSCLLRCDGKSRRK